MDAAVSVSAQAEILNSAIALFSRKGYAGTGVQEILDQAGLSKPTLYYYFESKAGLFRAILDHAYDEAFRMMDCAIQRECGVKEKLTAAASGLFEFTLANQDLTRIVFSTLFAPPEEIPPDLLNPAKRRRNFQLVEAILSDGQKAKEISQAFPVRDLAHGIFGAISHAIRTYLLTGDGELTRERAERIVQLFLDGARKG